MQKPFSKLTRNYLAVTLFLFSLLCAFQTETVAADGHFQIKKLFNQQDYQTAYDVLWNRLQKQPFSIDDNFFLAQAAIRLGFHDQAAAAMERVLIANPDHARARLNLGLSFYRLGAFKLAEDELEKLVNKDHTNPLALKAQVYLDKIRAQRSPHQFRGSAYLGYLYDSNVNTAPDDNFIETLDGSRRLAKDMREISDWGLTTGFRLSYDWDFGERGGYSWKNSLQCDNYFYNEENNSNLNLFSLASGPVYTAGDRYRIILPLTFEYLDYGNDPFFRTFGVMPRMDIHLSENFMTRIFATLQYQNYNWDERRDGAYAYFGIMPRFFWRDGKCMLQWRLGYENKWARKDFKAFRGPKSEVQFLNKLNRWLQHSLQMEYSRRRYEERDPLYSKTRDEDRYKFAAKFTVQLPWQLRSHLVLDYTSKKSNLDAYSFRRKRVSLKLEKRF